MNLLGTTTSEQLPLAKWLRRPEVSWQDIALRLLQLSEVSSDVAEQVTRDLKYSGYVARQKSDIQRQRRLAAKRIPEQFDYQAIRHLRFEAREKLTRIRPKSLAQAGRISGITPNDLALLMVHLSGRD